MLDVELTKSYGEFSLRARFQLNRETMVVTGPSGSGKTTLLRCLSGLERPDAGFIRFNGRFLYRRGGANLPPFRRPLGLMSQDDTVFPHLTVQENMLYAPSKYQKIPPLYAEVLARLKLTEREHSYPTTLSGGEKRRVMLARTLLKFSPLLFLDEPFAALDGKMAEQVSELLCDYCQRYTPTVIIVTHTHERLIRWSGQCLRIENGSAQAVERISQAFNEIYIGTGAGFS